MIVFFSCVSNEEKKRLSDFLHFQIKGTSKRLLKEYIAEGFFSVNGAVVSKDIIPKERDVISYSRDKVEFDLMRRIQNIGAHSIHVYKQYPEFIIVKKPREMHSVIQRADDPVTLADIIARDYPETVLAGRDVKESGLVQRLDFYTSGLIIAARTKEAWVDLHKKFLDGKITKEYHAFVEGDLEIDTEHEHSYLKTIEIQKNGTLVLCRTKKGSRHIVRKIFSSLGHPLCGDREYGAVNDYVELVLDGKKMTLTGFYLEATNIIGHLPDEG